jgi:hypothetical protein
LTLWQKSQPTPSRLTALLTWKSSCTIAAGAWQTRHSRRATRPLAASAFSSAFWNNGSVNERA